MELRELGFSETTYSETILSIKLGRETNAAPIGVLLGGENRLILKIYSGGKTYRMFLGGAEDCVVNITDNPILFYQSIFEKNRVRFIPARKVSSPRIGGCYAYVECEVETIVEYRDYIRVLLNSVLVEVCGGGVKTYNRAGPAIIEALVHYTKLPHYMSVDLGEAEEILRRIRVFTDIVSHSTKDSMLRSIAYRILRESENIFVTQRRSS